MGISSILNEVFSLLNSFLEPSLRTWLIVLIAFGVAMKHWVKLPGKLIPFAEIGAGILVAYLNSLGKGYGALEVVGYVLGQGLLLTAFSVFIYDVGRAVIEVAKKVIQKNQGGING